MKTQDQPSVTFVINFIHPCSERNCFCWDTLNCADCHKHCREPGAHRNCGLQDLFYTEFREILSQSHSAAQRDLDIAGRYTIVNDRVAGKLFRPGILNPFDMMVGIMLNTTPVGISEIERFPMEFVKKHKVR